MCTDPAQILIRFAPEFNNVCRTPAGGSLITHVDKKSTHQTDPSSVLPAASRGRRFPLFHWVKIAEVVYVSGLTVYRKMPVMLLSRGHLSTLNGRPISFILPGIEKVTHALWSPRGRHVTRKEQQGRPWHHFLQFFSITDLSWKISANPSLTSTFSR